MDTHPRTRASEDQPAILRDESRDGLSTGAQAACCFRYSVSKPTPFFQTIKVMAAILRARVRRAMVGFIPRAIFQIVIVVDVEAANGQEFLGAFQPALHDSVFPARGGF